MNLGQVHGLRPQTGLLIGGAGGAAADMVGVVVGRAVGGADQGAAAHPHGAGGGAQPLQPLGRTDHHGRRAVADGGAHGAGEGEDDGLVDHHLIHRHRRAVLRLRVEGGGGVVLGGEAGEVFLGRAEAGHVGAGLGGVEVHEQAAALARRLAAHGGDIGQHALAVVDVGPAHEGGGDALEPVGPDHLLGPDDQGDVASTRAQPLDRLMQGRRA